MKNDIEKNVLSNVKTLKVWKTDNDKSVILYFSVQVVSNHEKRNESNATGARLLEPK